MAGTVTTGGSRESERRRTVAANGAVLCRRKFLRFFPRGFRDADYLETERDYKYHWEAGQGAACPPGPILQMTTRCANARWIETDHEKGAVGHLAREFDHAWPGG